MLRPLVRLMIRSGITFPVLTDVLRGLFVDVALADVLTEARARTDSRISLVTGVHRKEVKRLRELPADQMTTPEVVTISSQIIARWLASAPFVDSQGRPLLLPRVADGKVAPPSFESLVASVTTDIRPRAVLDDWLSQGLVSLDDSDRVSLNTDAFIPRPGGEEQLFYFARNLHDHLSAAAANVSAAGAAPFLDRSVHYDRLTAAQAAELEAYARAEAVRVLLEVNRRALALVEANATTAMAGTAISATAGDPSGGDAVLRRVNFGVYVYASADNGDLPRPPAAEPDTARLGAPDPGTP